MWRSGRPCSAAAEEPILPDTPTTAGAPPAPLIVTVTLDPASQAMFDRLRKQYFPPSRNVLAAHVTLFHHLPGDRRDEVAAHLAFVCQQCPPSPMHVTGLRFLGRGAAFALAMPTVSALRRDLAARWAKWLTPQDRQAWKPHVTVQNKADPATARACFAQLQDGFVPFSGQVTGLHLWAYQGGPWEHLVQERFTGPPT